MGLFDVFKKKAPEPSETVMFGEFKLTNKNNTESIISCITDNKTDIAAGIYNDGLFTAIDKDSAVNIYNSWSWYFTKRMIPMVATAFGDLFLLSTENQHIYYFQTQYGTTDDLANDFDELFNRAFPHSSIKESLLREPYLQEVERMCGELAYGECYILKPWKMLGGTDKPENYTKGSLTVYHNLVSQAMKEKKSK